MAHDDLPLDLQEPLNVFMAERLYDNQLLAIDETPLMDPITFTALGENALPMPPTSLADNEIPAELQEPIDEFMAHRIYENDLMAVDQTSLLDPRTFKALPGVASDAATEGMYFVPLSCFSN
jgi:hypothetical protein